MNTTNRLTKCDLVRDLRGSEQKSASYAILSSPNTSDKPVYLWLEQLKVLAFVQHLFNQQESFSLEQLLSEFKSRRLGGLSCRTLATKKPQYIAHFGCDSYHVPVVDSVFKGLERLGCVELEPSRYPLTPTTIVTKAELYESVTIDYRLIPNEEIFDICSTQWSNGVNKWRLAGPRQNRLDPQCKYV